ncbi:patellin-4-like [Pyrus ussuriensis x Pyrus communis]|uniref:Patellin-4-like n=1 Tax=Pyrus ussuriensis x Pyrus communis TaxID=2448454 RepID=A0A5N5IH01_9ROSA|nr:patellin-4-like [Pyrus ussuriensis x Pyrus communis]
MATGEKIEEPGKDNKVTHPEEQEKELSKDTQDKGNEAKDLKNLGESGESKKNEDVTEKAVAEEKKKKNEDEIQKKNNAVEKGDEKSSTMAIEEKLENPQEDVKNVGEAGESKKNEGVIEKEVVEEKKTSEGETREIVVEEKAKEGEIEDVVLEEKKNNDQVEKVEKSSSFWDLKEQEKRALMELRSKLENAILENKLFKGNKKKMVEHEKEKVLEKEGGEKEKEIESEPVKEAEKEKESSEKVEEVEEKGKISEKAGEENFMKEAEKEKDSLTKVKEIEEKGKISEKEGGKINEGIGDEIVVEKTVKEKEGSKEVEEKLVVKEEKQDGDKPSKQEDEENAEKAEEGLKENINEAIDQDRKLDVIDKDITIWGVPLLPSKGDSGTDVILLKFLRAREFDVYDAFEMLRNTLQWRKDNKVDSILDEEFGDDLGSIGCMNGVGREGHPVCYSNFKLLGDEGVYDKILGTEENRYMFIRRRVQLMEKAIQNLDFKPGGVSSILLVNDLKDMPGPSKKELRHATKQVVGILQDNYPEFVARNIFINVPFWYYALSATSAVLLPFLTPRTNSKVVFARPSRVTEILLKYIAAEELPVHYGGLKREDESDFSTEDASAEITVYQSSSETIQIPVPEAGTTLMWEVTVLGWEVHYKEEFFPTDEGSYGIIIQKGRRVGAQEGSLRNSFTNNEPGNVVLTIENGSLMKKKRVCYRYKVKNGS